MLCNGSYYIQSLSRCVSTHELASIHAHRLRNADVVPTVLRILEEDQLTGIPARYAVELLGPLAPPSPFDTTSNSEQSLVPINQLFAFLLASHSPDASQAPPGCPLEAVHRSATPMTRVSGTTPPTLKSLRNAEGAEETPVEQIREKRDLVLNLLLGMRLFRTVSYSNTPFRNTQKVSIRSRCTVL